MARIDYNKLAVKGGPGLGSRDVGPGCGMHRNFITSALADLDVGVSATTLFVAPLNCQVQAVYVVFKAADTAATTVDVGYIRAGSADADYFVDAQATAGSATANTVESLSLTATSDIKAGDEVTYTVTASASTGTAYIVLEYTIDDEA